MGVRLGPGPVFVYESLQAARRWQTYAVRALFIAGLLVSLFVVVCARDVAGSTATLAQLSAAGESIFYAVVGTQIALVLLAAPAFAAGAVCIDKARGNLTHLLTTDLSSAEVVLGKLLSRLLPALGLVFATLPVLALCSLLGGIHPEALFGAFVVSLATAIFGCSLALALSVWGRKTHEVLMATYLILAVLLLAYPGWRALTFVWPAAPALSETMLLNPFFLAFGPYLRPGAFAWEDYALFAGGALAAALLLVTLATWRLRHVARKNEGTPQRRRPSALARLALPLPFGPPLDFNPVLWREWHRRRPSLWMKVLWIVYIIGALAAAAVALVSFGVGAMVMGPGLAAFVNAFIFSIGLLLVSVSSVTSLQEERTRGSLDVLMTTPLPTSAIVWGKWWGAYRAVPLVAVVPFLLACGAAFLGNGRGNAVELRPIGLALFGLLMLTQGAAVTSLGLALATWVKRFGRAVGSSVTVYVLVTASFVCLLLVLKHNEDLEGFAIGSPWFGAGQLTFSLADGHRLEKSTVWCVGWCVVYGGAALALVAATLATFDRCLGRVDAMSRRTPAMPPRRRRAVAAAK